MVRKKIKNLYANLSVRNRSLVVAYILAVSNSFFILLVHNNLTHIVWTASPFLMFLPGVIFTSWYGGFLPGLVATIIATIVGDYFFLNPLYTFTIADSADIARLFLFSTVGILVSIINQSFYNQKEEREKLLKRLHQIEQQKTTFLSMVAHELRTPLATVRLINELLIKKVQKTQDKEDLADLENINEELESLSQLVQNLLQFVRGEQGKLPLQKTKISMIQLIKNILKNYQQSYPLLGFNFDYEITNTQDIIPVDAKRIKQIFYNLLDNAVKASPPKGNITISLKQQNNKMIISISDQGIGIEPSEKKNIFKQYYQAKNAKGYGFGLGLYIAKQIVEKHNGKIWFVSKLQKGSTFTFSLPY